MIFREGSDGLNGGGAAGVVHIGEGVVDEKEAVHVLGVEFGEGHAGGEGTSIRRSLASGYW